MTPNRDKFAANDITTDDHSHYQSGRYRRQMDLLPREDKPGLLK